MAHLSKKNHLHRYQFYYRNLVFFKVIINRSYEYNILFIGLLILYHNLYYILQVESVTSYFLYIPFSTCLIQNHSNISYLNQ